MAREAVARLYDVNDNSLVFDRLTHTGRYDTGTITFHAKKGELIDLDKIHESVYATRLSGGTKSGLVSLDVTVEGRVSKSDGRVVLHVDGADVSFSLVKAPRSKETKAENRKEENAKASPPSPRPEAYAKLLKSVGSGEKRFRVTGRIDGWKGRWPTFLRKPAPKPHRLLVASFDVLEND